jgi:hypothetical protein
LGLLGVENLIADCILVGIDEEFARFNPKYLDLVEASLQCYFKIIEKTHHVSDWMHRVVDDWARRVDVPTNVAPWGYEAFLGILNLFLQQIGSESAPVQ